MTNAAGITHLFGAFALAALAGLVPASAQAPQHGAGSHGTAAGLPRTPDGRPDLQGTWDYRTLTPLERPKEFADRAFFTDEEAAAYERRAEERTDGRPPDDARTDPSVHPVWWLDYGKKVMGAKRTSLIIDPPDGRIPALTPEARARAAAARQARSARGPADGPEDRSTWERCITRGLPEGMLPAGYNNNIQIVQTPGYVVILSEMIHDARIVPIGNRQRPPASLQKWMGDSRGWWEGDTLVVETTNFSSRSNFRGSSSGLRLTERFSRTEAQALNYEFTVEDPTTWVRPWTAAWAMARSDGPIYEYACHEGNYGLKHIMMNARATP